MDTKIIDIALCDDNLSMTEQLDLHLKEYFHNRGTEYSIHKFTTPVAAFDYMRDSKIDILFMDLKFGTDDEDGMLWTKKILDSFPDTLVLILTAYEHRYKEGYRARAFRFMTKPLIRQELVENLDDCLKELDSLQVIQLKQKNINISLAVNDILYIEAYIGGTALHTKGQKVYYSEKGLLHWENLFQETDFFRIHKSYLINLAHVTDILSNRHEVILEKSFRLPVARRKWTEFQSSYIRYDVAKNH